MRTLTRVPPLQEESERAASGHAGADVVASSRLCPICGEAMMGRRTSACSDRCRAALSRRNRSDREDRLRGLVKVLAREAGLKAEDFEK